MAVTYKYIRIRDFQKWRKKRHWILTFMRADSDGSGSYTYVTPTGTWVQIEVKGHWVVNTTVRSNDE